MSLRCTVLHGFPNDYKQCQHSHLHKHYILSEEILQRHCIPYSYIVQRPGRPKFQSKRIFSEESFPSLFVNK